MVSLLLKQGARVRPPPGDPSLSKPSVLDLAVLKGDVELVKMLIEAGRMKSRNHRTSSNGYRILYLFKELMSTILRLFWVQPYTWLALTT